MLKYKDKPVRTVYYGAEALTLHVEQDINSTPVVEDVLDVSFHEGTPSGPLLAFILLLVIILYLLIQQ